MHHIRFFSRGGATSIHNTVGLCWFHYKQIHLNAIAMSGDPNAEITLTLNNGRTHTSWPATGPP